MPAIKPKPPAEAVPPVSSAAEPPQVSRYEERSKLVTTWPTALAPSGDSGWIAPQQWVETYGERYGIPSLNALRDAQRTGTVTAVPIERLGEVLIGGLSVSTKAQKSAFLPRDPALRADPGALTASVWLHKGTGVSVQSTPVTVNLFDADRSAAYRALASQAAVAGAPADRAVRIAWMTNKGMARVIEYLDLTTGTVRKPTKGEDIEAHPAVAAVPTYRQDDQVADLLAAVVRSKAPAAAPPAAPAVAPAKPTFNPATPHGDWITAAKEAASPSQRQARGSAFAASRAVGDMTPVTPDAHSHHLVYIAKSPADFNNKFTADGIAKIHAGIVSNFGPMLAAGSTPKGAMDASSRVFIAFRTVDGFSVVGQAPYAGLEPNSAAASIIIHRDRLAKIEQTISFTFAALDMELPNLPFEVALNPATTGFNIPATARREVWTAIHKALGWTNG